MIVKGWQDIPLSEVMHLEIDAVPVEELPEFPIAGVFSFARGLFKRESLPNTQTTYKYFHRLHKDMFVISMPKAWEGALAHVTDELDSGENKWIR
jgi:type I restriction enzyme S subunit